MSLKRIAVPFGRNEEICSIEEKNLTGVFESGIAAHKPLEAEEEIISKAFENPVNSESIEAMAAKARSAVIIASDHTRPVPSKLIFPELLKRLRNSNPGIDIKILIATGCHRETTVSELKTKFGSEIINSENIMIHDCRDEKNLVSLGKLPSGGELQINRIATECDLLISEGFIEPHFFAGFSGGRKSILPGIAGERTVMGNHCAEFISSPFAKAGILENNPIHEDMIYAAEKAGLKFIINVVINENKKVIHAVAGNPIDAHLKACEFLRKLCVIKVPESDIVITSNGGYPLDQNIYQSVKGMTAAENVCAQGGTIIMVSACSDGHGGESFYRQLAESRSPAELLKQIEKIPQNETLPDQWEAQILARILSRFKVIMVAEKSQEETIRKMHMCYADSIHSAIKEAVRINGINSKIAVIKDGVSVISEKI